MADDAEYMIVAFGAAARIAKNAIRAAREKGIKVGLIRPITLWPFPKDILMKRAGQVKAFICAELNMGQMIDDVRLATECARPVHLVNRAGGMVFTPEEIIAKIEEVAGGANK